MNYIDVFYRSTQKKRAEMEMKMHIKDKNEIIA